MTTATHLKVASCDANRRRFLLSASDSSIPSSSYAYPGPPVSTYAFRAGVAVAWVWGDTPIGDAPGDYPTGIPGAQAWAPLGLPPQEEPILPPAAQTRPMSPPQPIIP